MDIKSVIKSKGLTIVETAKRIGISQVRLTAILRAEDVKYSTLKKIADAIGCKVGDFFADEVSQAISQNELYALVEYKGKIYKATSIARLDEIVRRLKEA